jgi:hypothetical protein
VDAATYIRSMGILNVGSRDWQRSSRIMMSDEERQHVVHDRGASGQLCSAAALCRDTSVLAVRPHLLNKGLVCRAVMPGRGEGAGARHKCQPCTENTFILRELLVVEVSRPLSFSVSGREP